MLNIHLVPVVIYFSKEIKRWKRWIQVKIINTISQYKSVCHAHKTNKIKAISVCVYSVTHEVEKQQVRRCVCVRVSPERTVLVDLSQGQSGLTFSDARYRVTKERVTPAL